MNYEEFIERFQPIRNTYDLIAPLENRMFENDEGDQMEYVESKDPRYVWSYDPRIGLVNGLHYRKNYIGYMVCKKDCSLKPGTIHVKF